MLPAGSLRPWLWHASVCRTDAKHRNRCVGEILIVSSKEPNIPPAGYALAVATLVDCRPISVLDEPAAQCRKFSKSCRLGA